MENNSSSIDEFARPGRSEGYSDLELGNIPLFLLLLSISNPWCWLGFGITLVFVGVFYIVMMVSKGPDIRQLIQLTDATFTRVYGFLAIWFLCCDPSYGRALKGFSGSFVHSFICSVLFTIFFLSPSVSLSLLPPPSLR
jgi:hypothetical protein